MHSIRVGLSLAVCACLAACGGGSADEPTGFNVDAAFTTLLTQGGSFANLQGTIPLGATPLLVNESHTYQPAGSQSVIHTRVTSTSSDPTPRTDIETIQFTLAPLTISAITNEVGTAHYRRLAPLPMAAQVGSSGAYEETTDAGAVTRLDWALETGSADTAWACLSRAIISGGGSSTRTCLNIDMRGNILKARFEYRLPAGGPAYTVQ